MALTCKILYWDFNYQVGGLLAELGPNRRVEVRATAQGLPGMSFASQLHQVSVELKNHQADAVLLGGFIPEFICFELSMPKLERAKLRNALQFELSRRIPAALDGMVTMFRVMPGRNDRQVIVRVGAVRSRVWHDLLDRIREAGIRFDAVCHPLLAASVSGAGAEACFPASAPGVMLVENENGLAEMRMSSSSAEDDRTGLMLAEYALSKHFHADKPWLSDLPSELRLHRFKHRRNFAVFFGSVALSLGGFLGYLHWCDRSEQIQAYRREIFNLDSRLRRQQGQLEEMRVLGQFAEKMNESIAEVQLLPVLEMLTSKLPPNTWVTGFRTGNGKVSVTLSVTGDSSNLSTALADLGEWTVENQRRQQGGDGTETWYVNLMGK